MSGIAAAVPFKRQHWPGLDEREYRISQGHDAAAALVDAGAIVAAAAEERFDRRKHSPAFPAQAACFCLERAGIALDAVDEVAHAFDYSPYSQLYSLDPVSAELYAQAFSPEAFRAQAAAAWPGLPAARIHAVPHHLAHAASAAFTSGWDECLVAVIDAMGETQGASLYRAEGGRLQRLFEISASDSIGIFYSLLTLHMGFDFNSDEYKIMGLAPYGDPARFRAFFEQAVELRPDGGLRIPALRLNRTREERESYSAARRYLEENLLPARPPQDELRQEHRDLAAGLQECLNRAVLHICGHFGRATGLRRLAMAGGVALNCAANGQLMRSGLFDEIYVQPAAGDDGAALGAALYRASLRGEVLNRRMAVPLFGPDYGPECLEGALARFNGSLAVTRHGSLAETCAAAARLIADGRVVAWHRGPMEFGPRALGNRSILADPGHPEMRDRINAMVKRREAFRPFAPAATAEQAHRWFAVPEGAQFPYMIATVMVRPEHRAALPAVTHVDGSARLQTVSAADNPAFHTLLKAVGRETGREMLLNTSFNVKGQPIVNTPAEAIDTFLGTGIEYLFIGDAQLERR